MDVTHNYPIRTEFDESLNIDTDPYEPLTIIDWNKIRRECHRNSAQQCPYRFPILFQDDQELSQIDEQGQPEIPSTQSNDPREIIQRGMLPSILNNVRREPQIVQLQEPQRSRGEDFHFRNLSIPYAQTPIFRAAIQTPFSAFNHRNKNNLAHLNSKNSFGLKIQAIPLQANPLPYKREGAAFFIGLGLHMKSQDHQNIAKWFYKLACFIEPFNPKVWQYYIEHLKANCQFEEAFIAAKTAFLFRQCSDFGVNYLSLGDKFRVPMYCLRGLLASLRNPENYDKIIFESAKYEIKNRKPWRGLILLLYFCINNDFKPSVSQQIIFLCKQLENRGFRKEALYFLEMAFDRCLSALEAYQVYLQMLIRQRRSKLTHKDMNYLQKIFNTLSQETRFKFALDIADYYQNHQQMFRKWINKSYEYIALYCREGCGRQRALRILYCAMFKCKKIQIPQNILGEYKDDNMLIFQKNRFSFIHCEPLAKYEFSEWKYYIHYSLVEDEEMLNLGINKWPHVGRLVAELIHLKRKKQPRLKMLKYWGEKIKEIPKSGELWCEGGRIYSELQEYSNAIKCFENAIHFTPEYGDSFFELLKVYLIKGQFLQLERLKNNYLVSEPVYGSLCTFWRFSGDKMGYSWLNKLSLTQAWNLAKSEITDQLYTNDKKQGLSASTHFQENKLSSSKPLVREKYFCAYEQFDKKS